MRSNSKQGVTGDADEDLVGSRISHFLIQARLGAGGMGVVYLARDVALGGLVALKLVSDEVGPAARQRLVLEGRESARVQHPRIATFYEAGEDHGRTYIAMEYVRGRSLRERLSDGPLPAHEAIVVMSDLLGAVGHAHASGLLHRDIKPENVMLVPDGGAKLLDFGLAAPLTAEELSVRAKGEAAEAGSPLARATRLTEAGVIVGTPGYMPPEQVLGQELDARSDLFALGAVVVGSWLAAPLMALLRGAG